MCWCVRPIYSGINLPLTVRCVSLAYQPDQSQSRKVDVNDILAEIRERERVPHFHFKAECAMYDIDEPNRRQRCLLLTFYA